jgi:hypothetical protein
LGTKGRYRGESHAIERSQVQTEQGMKDVYSVRNAKNKLVYQFEQEGNQFKITTDKMSGEDKEAFLKAGGKLVEADIERLRHDRSGKSQLETLGDLAPSGTKATIVGNMILDKSGRDSYKNDRYEFQRDAKTGQLIIQDGKTGNTIYQTGGKESLSRKDLSYFDQVHQQLQTETNLPQFAKPQAQLQNTPGKRQPTADEISKWLVAAKILEQSPEEIQWIKEIGNQAARAAGKKDFKELHETAKDQPIGQKLSKSDAQKMRRDLKMFDGLVQQQGLDGVLREYAMRQQANPPAKQNQTVPMQRPTVANQPVVKTTPNVNIQAKSRGGR